MSLPNPTPPPKPDSALQPDAGLPPKPTAGVDWRSSRWRTVRLFSLLVLVSAGLHGVGMLVPLPEKQEVIEKEEVLPEPIQISDLPIEILKEEEILEEAVAPPAEPPPPPPPEPEPQIVIQQPVEAPPPAVLPESLPESLLEDPTPDPPLDPMEDPANDPPENPPPKNPDPKPPEQTVRQSYDSTGTTQNEASSALIGFFNGGLGSTYGFVSTDMKSVTAGGGRTGSALLSIPYPADSNSCFEEVSSYSLTTVVAAIVDDFTDESGQTSRAVVDVQLLQKTGYAVVDDWVEQVVLGGVDTGTSIYNLIADNTADALSELGSDAELFSFKVIVELPEQPCS